EGEAYALGGILMLLNCRWLALLTAFVFLVLGGTLHGWVRDASHQFLLIVAALTLMEVLLCKMELWMYHVNAGVRTFAVPVPSHLRLIAALAAILIPLCVMAGGFLGSRTVFAAGLAGALIAACGPFPAPPPPSLASQLEGKSVAALVFQ